MNILTFDSLDSTNDYAKEHIHTLPHFTIIRARFQTAGRGQFQRHWQSNPNENILMTLVLKSNLQPQHIPFIETTAIQSCLTLLDQYHVHGNHKLPNDILVSGKKIAGMLIETKQTGLDVEYVLLGIGFNINQTSFQSLPNATSLAKETGQSFSIDHLFTRFIDGFSSLKSI